LKQVVLSLSDKGERRLRDLAQKTRQGRKGALSETVEDGLILLEKRLKQKSFLRRLKKLAGEDLVFGVGKFAREEAYR